MIKPTPDEADSPPNTVSPAAATQTSGLIEKSLDTVMAASLALMALLVFGNVVLRYGFGTGVAAAEELSRLLFVWMVFLGAVAAYPAGEHMAFTSLLALLEKGPRYLLTGMTLLVRLLMLLACALLARGAWLQIEAAWGSVSPVMGYPIAMLPLPVLMCAMAIGAMVVREIVQQQPMALGHVGEVD